MATEVTTRHEMVVVGLGGAGVLTVGRQVALAGSTRYQYVTYYPSYSWQMRGGSSECSIILSDEQINSPILEQSQNMLVLAPHLMNTCVSRVKSGGLIVVGNLGLDKQGITDDFHMFIVPQVEQEAAAIGNLVVANTIMLGAYVQITGAFTPESLEIELEKQFSSKAKVLEMNRQAFRRGLELGRELTD